MPIEPTVIPSVFDCFRARDEHGPAFELGIARIDAHHVVRQDEREREAEQREAEEDRVHDPGSDGEGVEPSGNSMSFPSCAWPGAEEAVTESTNARRTATLLKPLFIFVLNDSSSRLPPQAENQGKIRGFSAKSRLGAPGAATIPQAG